MMRQRPYHIGSYIKVYQCVPYRLPAGVPDGATVKVISFGIGMREVEYRGVRYEIPMACVDSGWIEVVR
jgi:hypothetical protein